VAAAAKTEGGMATTNEERSEMVMEEIAIAKGQQFL
jgi:hypothetical protein